MKICRLSFIALLFSISLSALAVGGKPSPGTLLAKDLKPFGRYLITNNKLELISSAVHFGFSFTGEECSINTSLSGPNEHSYLQYELDGVYQKRIRINGDATDPVVIKAAGAGRHTVWVYKCTEATTGPIFISSVTASDIKALKVEKAPLIEFIGNSITCGAAADTSDLPCGTGDYQDQHNAYMAYGPRVARDLSANYILSSVSGIGVYRTWNKENLSMPMVYENADFQQGGTRKWNFGTYSPRVVSIALGTNDLSRGDGVTPRSPFDAERYTRDFVTFIKLVKSKYPKARIALLSSPMIKGADRTLLEKCLTSVGEKVNTAYPQDKPVAVFLFSTMNPGGCGGHPSVADHALMAQQLKPFFAKLLQE